MRSSSRAAVIVALVASLVAGAGFVIRAWRTPDAARAGTAAVAAFVNGTPITADEVEVRLADILPSASYHGHVDANRLLSLRRAALDELVLDELIYREAMAAGRPAASAAVDSEVAAVKARFESPDLFASALQENGVSERELRKRLAKAVVVREARAAHARQAIGRPDVEAYYRQNSGKFQRPEQVHLLEVLVRVDPADPASEFGAKRKARRLLGRLQHNADFATLARAFSEDEYRVKDGDMGFVHRGRLDEAFDTAVFEAPVGRFAVARSLHGYRVFKVIERRPATQLSLEEARPIIAEGLERQRQDEQVRGWHARLLGRARVEIRDAALRGARAADLPAAPLTMANRLRTASPARSGE
jgi:parvulin-like peptidyl-prolyl isomerase